jgi:DNA-binding NarL/FixJ family response regulator
MGVEPAVDLMPPGRAEKFLGMHLNGLRRGGPFPMEISLSQGETPEGPLIISMHDKTLYAERVIRPSGYIMKQEGPEKIVQAIRKVLSGGISVSDGISTQILHTLSGSKGCGTSVSTLTDREFEIYRLLGQGKVPHEIARPLHLSIKAVDTRRAHIRQKLGLRNATELIHHATRWTANQG